MGANKAVKEQNDIVFLVKYHSCSTLQNLLLLKMRSVEETWLGRLRLFAISLFDGNKVVIKYLPNARNKSAIIYQHMI